ncbi:MAG: type I methionyl aminopeptidase [Candidatus Chloroheliales bacterium]|nr:MAG: type I methionyl aminopeptidase [Chloroflexota bacterium]
MAITIKNKEQFELMRRAGRITAQALALLRAAVKPGVTTRELDSIAYNYIKSQGAIPSFKGYGGQMRGIPRYPATICASVNEVIVHGIPSDVPLNEGELLSIDCGAIYRGFHGDAAISLAVGGNASPLVQRLLAGGEEALRIGIIKAQAGNHVGAISSAIQQYVEGLGFHVVHDYGGHGIGVAMHEDPHVPNEGHPSDGVILRPGMAIAIEPMLSAGSPDVDVASDSWAVIIRDHALSSHFEHTVAITENGPEILTLP